MDIAVVEYVGVGGGRDVGVRAVAAVALVLDSPILSRSVPPETGVMGDIGGNPPRPGAVADPGLGPAPETVLHGLGKSTRALGGALVVALLGALMLSVSRSPNRRGPVLDGLKGSSGSSSPSSTSTSVLIEARRAGSSQVLLLLRLRLLVCSFLTLSSFHFSYSFNATLLARLLAVSGLSVSVARMFHKFGYRSFMRLISRVILLRLQRWAMALSVVSS